MKKIKILFVLACLLFTVNGLQAQAGMQPIQYDVGRIPNTAPFQVQSNHEYNGTLLTYTGNTVSFFMEHAVSNAVTHMRLNSYIKCWGMTAPLNLEYEMAFSALPLMPGSVFGIYIDFRPHNYLILHNTCVRYELTFELENQYTSETITEFTVNCTNDCWVP